MNSNNAAAERKRFQLTLGADNLPKYFFHGPNAYAKVVISGGPMGGQVIGRTSVRPKSRSPKWFDTLYIAISSSEYMPLKIEVWRARGAEVTDNDVFLGEATMEATEILNSLGRCKTTTLSCAGTVTAALEESIKGNYIGTARLQLRGLDMKNIEPGLFGLGRSDPYFEVSKKIVDPAIGVVRWNVVHRSKHVNNNLNPMWEEFQLTLEELCFCDVEWPLRITVFDWQNVGVGRQIGYFETSLKGLHQRISIRGNADREQAFDLNCDDLLSNSGFVVVLVCEIWSREGEKILLDHENA